jgi:hypothetical protein
LCTDGHIECDDESDPDTCHGFLLAVYANDLSGNKAQFFRRYQRTRPEPVTIIADQDLEGKELLLHAHKRLMDYHLYEKLDANYTGFEANQILQDIEPPSFGILSTWNTAIPWAGGAWHAWTDTNNIEKAKQPFVEHDIFVVNEAYSLLQGWAEGSLKTADEILEQYFDVPRPWDFPDSDLNQIVRQTNSQECTAVAVDTGSTGESSGGGGGDDGGMAAILCFTGDALVEMGDGSLKAIRDVQAGDVVSTGTGFGSGLVTTKLVHPVQKVVQVATAETPMGALIGTPDHPILHEGEWIELGDLPHPKAKLESRHVEAFYNLEVDGDEMEESSHSYVVNGVVASGLGDSEGLNLRFPRQKVWKTLAEEETTK